MAAPSQHTVVADENRRSTSLPDNDAICDDDEDILDEDITIEKVRYRIAHYQSLLRQLEEQQKNGAALKPLSDAYNQKKKLERSKTIVLKHMLKMMRECDVQGFVYGIISNSGKAISASSDNLRDWWKQQVRLERNGLAAITRYNADKGIVGPSSYTPAKATAITLMDVQDSTLCSVLSALLPQCDPPQRKFPIEKKVLPPWWPKGDESWWHELGFPNGLEEVPYKKPHDLRKAIKAGVIMAVLKNMIPNMDLICMSLRKSKSLQEKMAAKEILALCAVLKHEEEIFWEVNKDLPRPNAPKNLIYDDLIAISSPDEEEYSVRAAYSHDASHATGKAIAETSGSRKRAADHDQTSGIMKRKLYVCMNSGCEYTDLRCGFLDKITRDHHMMFECMFKNRHLASQSNVHRENNEIALQTGQHIECDQRGLVEVPAEGQQAIETVMNSYEGNANPAGMCLNDSQVMENNHFPVQMGNPCEQQNMDLQPNHVQMQQEIFMDKCNALVEDLTRLVNGNNVGVPGNGQQVIETLMDSYEGNTNPAGMSLNDSQYTEQNHVSVGPVQIGNPCEQQNMDLQLNHVQMQQETVLDGNGTLPMDLIRPANGDNIGVPAYGKQSIETMMNSCEGNANPAGMSLNDNQFTEQNNLSVGPIQIGNPCEQQNMDLQLNHVQMQQETVLDGNGTLPMDPIRPANGDNVEVPAYGKQAIETMMNSCDGNADPAGMSLNDGLFTEQNHLPVGPVQIGNPCEQQNMDLQLNHVQMQQETVLDRNNFLSEDLIRLVNEDSVVPMDYLYPIQPEMELNGSQHDHCQIQLQLMEPNQSLPQQQMVMSQSVQMQQMTPNQTPQQLQPYADTGGMFEFMQQQNLHQNQNLQPCIDVAGNSKFMQQGSQTLADEPYANLGSRNFEFVQPQQNQPANTVSGHFSEFVVSMPSQMQPDEVDELSLENLMGSQNDFMEGALQSDMRDI